MTQPARLWLVRHPVPAIDPGTCYGRLDVGVTDPAVDAALARCRALLPLVDTIWSSPLRRCTALARRLADRLQLDDDLTELDFGSWEGMRWSAIPRPELDAWAADPFGFRPGGGECASALLERWRRFLSRLDHVDDAVVVTHGGVIRMAMADAGKWTASESLARRIGFGEVVPLATNAASRRAPRRRDCRDGRAVPGLQRKAVRTAAIANSYDSSTEDLRTGSGTAPVSSRSGSCDPTHTSRQRRFR